MSNTETKVSTYRENRTKILIGLEVIAEKTHFSIPKVIDTIMNGFSNKDMSIISDKDFLERIDKMYNDVK